MQTSNVRILLRSKVEELPKEPNEAPQKYCYRTEAVFEEHDGQYVLIYPESAAEGMEDTVTTLAFSKTEPPFATLSRKGKIHTTLAFSTAHRRQDCTYDTPYGSFDFQIVTEELRFSLHEKGGTMHLVYRMETNGRPMQKNTLSLLITPFSEVSQ